MRKKYVYMVLMLILGTLILTGCDCTECNENVTKVWPDSIEHVYLYSKQNSTDRLHVVVRKYTVNGEPWTLYYMGNYTYQLVFGDNSSSTTQDTDDSSSILHQDTYFEY